MRLRLQSGLRLRWPVALLAPIVLPLAGILAVSPGCIGVRHGAAARGGSTDIPTPPAVRVTTQRDGDAIRFLVRNDELCEITMTFDMQLCDMSGSVKFPYTAVFPGRRVSRAFELRRANPAARWNYAYTNYYELGGNSAKHRDSAIYRLPYAPGARFEVTQGHNGGFSHTGSNKYAIDWNMPEGTTVCAAREGLVVKLKDDSDKGGSTIKFDRFNNFILIRHDDGTLGHYCHLQQNGSLVREGQRVEAGQPIAKSGNTGFTSGPHLHFCVFKTLSGKERESIPVRFQTQEAGAVPLVFGRTYQAPAVRPAKAANGSTVAAIPLAR